MAARARNDLTCERERHGFRIVNLTGKSSDSADEDKCTELWLRSSKADALAANSCACSSIEALLALSFVRIVLGFGGSQSAPETSCGRFGFERRRTPRAWRFQDASRRPRAYQRRHLLRAVQLTHSSPVIAPARARVIASGTIIISFVSHLRTRTTRFSHREPDREKQRQCR